MPHELSGKNRGEMLAIAKRFTAVAPFKNSWMRPVMATLASISTMSTSGMPNEKSNSGIVHVSYSTGTPDLFFYGIHGVEPLFTLMGPGCETVARVQAPDADHVTGLWKNGRVGTYRGWGQFASSYANAMARALAEPLSVTVVGPEDDAIADELWTAARSVDDPARSVQRIVPERDVGRLEQLGFPPGRTAAYVCVGTTCSAPLTDEGSLRRELERARGRLEKV